jgi:hypothetical protein
MKPIRPALARLYDFCAQSAMGAAILLLPLTSLPLLSRLMRGTMVAPPTIVFIFILAVGWLPVQLVRGAKIPRETVPFLVFVILALISSVAAFFIPFPPYKGITVPGAELDALVTLAVGVATYFVVVMWHRQPGRMATTLRLINWSGAAILVWSFIQLAFIRLYNGQYPDILVKAQALLSTRSLLDYGFRGRVGGFTYEPSWLAHQLNLIYLSYWLAATITGYSAAKKIWRFSVENFLLVGGLVVLYFTISRIGLLAFLLMAAFVFYRLNVVIVRWLQKRIEHRPAILRWRIDKFIPTLTILLVILVYLGVVVGLLNVWAHFDPRTASLLSLRSIPTNLFDFAFSVDFAERVVYWSIGWNVFAHYPLLGVGLGNNGFFFQQYLPNIGYRLTEIVTLLDNTAILPNIKSFWIRLLAETGLLGFSTFAAWQFVLWKGGAFLRLNRSAFLRTLGWMGAFAILAFLAEGFSIDSFALPYLFVAMGLLTAASQYPQFPASPRNSQRPEHK